MFPNLEEFNAFLKPIYQQAPEIQVFMMIRSISQAVADCEQDIADRKVSFQEFLNGYPQLKFIRQEAVRARTYSSRFGVTDIKPDKEELTPMFNAWYRWWAAYWLTLNPFQLEWLEQEVFVKINAAIMDNQLDKLVALSHQVRNYRPVGDWRDQLQV